MTEPTRVAFFSRQTWRRSPGRTSAARDRELVPTTHILAIERGFCRDRLATAPPGIDSLQRGPNV